MQIARNIHNLPSLLRATSDNHVLLLGLQSFSRMDRRSLVLCVASRGRGDNNAQHFEARTDGCTSTITSVTKDNLIMTTQDKSNTEYHPHPTKEDLLEYFGQRIRVRKMTPTEALRLMDVDDSDIEKMRAAGIAKTNLYKLAGNSIVVSCLYHIFRTMFIPGQPENEGNRNIKQLTIFDYL